MNNLDSEKKEIFFRLIEIFQQIYFTNSQISIGK